MIDIYQKFSLDAVLNTFSICNPENGRQKNVTGVQNGHHLLVSIDEGDNGHLGS